MADILVVGIATIDLVNQVARYPREDQEVRALTQNTVRGGNAANTAVMLARLGHRTAFAGVLAADAGADLIRRDLARHGVDATRCAVYAGGHTPTSCVVLGVDRGSRTIVHYRDLPELGADHFAALDLQRFDWVHFEGRDADVTASMLNLAADHAATSLEVEKPRPGIERCFELPGLLVCSRHYVESLGYADASDFIDERVPPATQVVCAWGEDGAWVRVPGRDALAVAAVGPGPVVDTLGAGDVFNAGLIHGLVTGRGVQRAAQTACELAGRKCAVSGFDAVPLEGI